jgi:hypothetical protein
MPNIDNFVPRPIEMKRIEDYILTQRHRRRILVIWAAWGFGKTQLAIKFITEHSKDFMMERGLPTLHADNKGGYVQWYWDV